MRSVYLSILLFSSTLFAEVQSEEIKNLESAESMFISAKDVSKIESQRDKYLESKNLSLGNTKKGTYIGWAEESIYGEPTDIDFAQKRVLAFERAFISAKSEFLRQKAQKFKSIVSQEFLSDGRGFETDESTSLIESIGKKLLTLTTKELDLALEKLGLNSDEISNLNVTRKREIAKNSLTKKVIAKASQTLSGVRVIKSFEDLNSIGVLIIQNDKFTEFAKSLAKGKIVGNVSTKDIKEYIIEKLDSLMPTSEAYIPNFGLRVMSDDVGNRALVSFAQFSPKVTKADSKMKIDMAIKSARKQAYNLALAQISEFLSSTINFNEESLLKDDNKITMKLKDDMTSEEEISEISDYIKSNTKQSSEAKLEDIVKIKTWSANHPETGHLIVGSVLLYAPIKSTKGTVNKKSPKVKDKVYESVDLEDEADF